MVSGKDESADRPESSEENKQPESEFGAPLNDFGAPLNDFGAPLNDFGAPLNDFGAPLNDFGAKPAAPAPGWSPAPGPQSPELAWRPADASIPAPPPQYRAPDSWGPTTGQYPAQYPGNGMSTGQFPAVEGAGQAPSTPDVEQTVKIPPGGSQSAPGDPEQATRISDADKALAERNSAGEAAANGAVPAQTGSPDSWWRSAPSGFPPVPPSTEPDAPQGESLSWADDPIVKALTPKTPAPQAKPEQEPRPWRKIAVIAGGAVVLLAVAGSVIFALTRGGDQDTTAAGVTTIGKGAPTNTAAALSCPPRHEGKLTIGNGAGGTGSGVDAILGFQHGFYADRSGEKARSFVAPDSPTVSQADVMQSAGIDKLKPGTSYCLQIVGPTPVPAPVPPVPPGAPPAAPVAGVFETYDVDITEHHADGTTQVYAQRVTVVERDGKHLIYSIEERS
ncbi:hypothetical protein [Nocardia concava]|uniref:hypothetical protein n=1 Tax=Nocardia concava TaxID=257281 RepID=UPI000595022B|nr:hypothetical protein [Nocardia concava]